MKTELFDYYLPEELIAQEPVWPRDSSRLLVYDVSADEIRHKRFYQIEDDDGRQCGCGRKGCLETYCSATGVARTAREFLVARPEPSLLDVYKRQVNRLHLFFHCHLRK